MTLDPAAVALKTVAATSTPVPEEVSVAEVMKLVRVTRNAVELSLPTAYAALQATPTSGCDVLFIGDSIAEGASASPDASLSRRWIQLFVNALRDEFQPASIPGGRGYVPAYYDVATHDPFTFVQSGAVTENTLQGIGRRAAVLAATGRLDIAVESATSIDVVVRRDGVANGSLAVSVNGAAPTVISCAPNPFAGGGFRHRITFDSRARHTIRIDHHSGAAATVEGIMVYDGDETAGVRLWDGTKAGYTANSFASNATWPQSIQAVTPDIAVIALGVNDVRTARTPAQFIGSIGTIAGWLRTQTVPGGSAVSPNVPIIFVHYAEPNDGSYPNWANYANELRSWATTDGNSLVVDLSTVMAKGEEISGDNLHPTNAGHALIAQHVTEAVIGQVSLTDRLVQLLTA